MEHSRFRIRFCVPCCPRISPCGVPVSFPCRVTPQKPSQNRTCPVQASDSPSAICSPSVFGLLGILSSSPLVLVIELRTSGSHGLLERRSSERERIFDSGTYDIARQVTRFQTWPSGMHTPWPDFLRSRANRKPSFRCSISFRVRQPVDTVLPRSISCPEV